jgi:hypothetical protein
MKTKISPLNYAFEESGFTIRMRKLVSTGSKGMGLRMSRISDTISLVLQT